MREAVFNDVDEHHPRCNEQCHGAIHYLSSDDHMGEIATAVVTSREIDDGADVYVNGKFVQRLYEGDE